MSRVTITLHAPPYMTRSIVHDRIGLLVLGHLTLAQADLMFMEVNAWDVPEEVSPPKHHDGA